jgi:hypothetical protein
MVPGETTSVSMRDVDDYEQPTLAYASGNAHLADRYLPLDRFGSALIGARVAKAISDGYAPGRQLTYTPRKNQPGTKQATPSAQGVLDRFLADLGVANDDTTASSVTLWRVVSVYATQGEDAALQISGRRTKEQMLAQLNLPVVEGSEPADDEITSFGDAA